MMSQVSLGHYFYEIALIMRDSMLVSKLLSNSEIWYNMTKDQYIKLERIDELFFRRIFNVPISTPKESFYIEAGCLPLKYVIKIRRMMYLWHILHIKKEELLYKFYSAQNLATSKGDWVEQIKKEKAEMNLQLSDNKIRDISKEKFRELVKMKVKVLAIKHLNEMKIRHSKTKNLVCSELKSSEYLKSKNLNKEEIRNLFKLRNRMINVKLNFKSSNKENIWCKTCYLFPETQQHLTTCPVLKSRLKHLVDYETLDHSMIFQNLERQEKFAKMYTIILKGREDMLPSDKDE